MYIKCLLFFLFPLPVLAQVSTVRLTATFPPHSGNVFVAGSFNHWTAGDSLYQMKKLNDSTATLDLPVYRHVRYEYKYTLGSWSGVEKTDRDSSTTNRYFVSSGRKMRIKDRVSRWQASAPSATSAPSAQMARIMAMKDSLMAGLQPKLDGMLALLKEYAANLLQEHPDAVVDRKITSEVVGRFAEIYGKINDLCHKVFEGLSPDQKQKIRTALNDPKGQNDFINTLMSALNQATMEKGTQ